MKASLDCIPCFVRQAVRAAALSTDDPALQRQAVNEALARIAGLSLDSIPALLSRQVYAAVREVTGTADPFAEMKAESNQTALAFIPGIRTRIGGSPNPLYAAVEAALAGNVIDMGVEETYTLDEELESTFSNGNSIDDYQLFSDALDSCKSLLYLCDNAGEIALDVLLIEQLKKHTDVVAAVKSGPAINDATMADAKEVGLTDLAPVIETGAAAVGVDWENASDEFQRAFTEADIILSKGQANFETLEERGENIFFLFKTKCPVVAKALGVEEGATVFMSNRTRVHPAATSA